MEKPKIGIVGPCGAGKSALACRLRARGLEVREIAQEHSFAPTMWIKITDPDYLVFLDVSYPIATSRKQFNWTEGEFIEQQKRLRHARENCHIYIHTDNLTIEEVYQKTIFQLDIGHNLPSDV